MPESRSIGNVNIFSALEHQELDERILVSINTYIIISSIFVVTEIDRK